MGEGLLTGTYSIGYLDHRQKEQLTVETVVRSVVAVSLAFGPFREQVLKWLHQIATCNQVDQFSVQVPCRRVRRFAELVVLCSGRRNEWLAGESAGNVLTHSKPLAVKRTLFVKHFIVPQAFNANIMKVIFCALKGLPEQNEL